MRPLARTRIRKYGNLNLKIVNNVKSYGVQIEDLEYQEVNRLNYRTDKFGEESKSESSNSIKTTTN